MWGLILLLVTGLVRSEKKTLPHACLMPRQSAEVPVPAAVA